MRNLRTYWRIVRLRPHPHPVGADRDDDGSSLAHAMLSLYRRIHGWLRRERQPTHGVNLVELLVVIAIIGTLMGLLLPDVSDDDESISATKARPDRSGCSVERAGTPAKRRRPLG